jgi:hypothetical protein
MTLKSLVTVTIAVLLFSDLFAFSFASKAVTPVLGDSVSGFTTSGSNASLAEKKIGIGTRVTKRMSGWFKKFFPDERKKTSAKKAFGLASVLCAGLGLIVLFTGSVAAVIFLFGAILFGITSLVLPGEKSENASPTKGDRSKKKGRNTLALIGLLVPLVLIITILIAFAVYQPK